MARIMIKGDIAGIVIDMQEHPTMNPDLNSVLLNASHWEDIAEGEDDCPKYAVDSVAFCNTTCGGMHERFARILALLQAVRPGMEIISDPLPPPAFEVHTPEDRDFLKADNRRMAIEWLQQRLAQRPIQELLAESLEGATTRVV